MFVFNKKPFLIADISLDLCDLAEKEEITYVDAAKFLIDEAMSCGMDAVSFQSFKAENIISRDLSAYDSMDSADINSYFDSFKKYDMFGVGEFRQLAQYCRDIGITFLAAPLDYESVDYLDDFLDVFEISSADIDNIPFIEYIASKNKPILLSTGAATLMEIKTAIKAIEDVSTVDVVIMHSVLSFPTDYQDANLLMIKDLIHNFPEYEIGYSDHTQSDENMLILTTAYNYGAVVLKKHFTYDRHNDSVESKYSMDPDDVIKLKKNLLFLSKVNGRVNKQPLICESSAKREYRKSIVAKTNIKKGKIISESDVAFKRPGVGISPAYVDDIIGKIATKKISKDALITSEMLK